MESVLVVEDDVHVRAIIGRMLEHLGYHVTTAASGPIALQQLAGGMAVDLCLLDVAMPGMSGVETAGHMRALRPGVRLLFATGGADGHDVARLQLLDVPVLAKPFTLAALAAAVRRALNGLG